MRKRPTKVVYESLAPEEAFRLAVSALARGDDSEAEEILTHLSTGWIQTRHPRFDRELDGTRALVAVAAPNLGRFIGWLQVLEATALSIEDATDGSLGLAEPSGECYPVVLAFAIAGRLALRRLGAMIGALAEVAASHDLDGAEVLQAFMPALAFELGARAEHISAVGYDPEAMESFRALLEEAWYQATN